MPKFYLKIQRKGAYLRENKRVISIKKYEPKYGKPNFVYEDYPMTDPPSRR